MILFLPFCFTRRWLRSFELSNAHASLAQSRWSPCSSRRGGVGRHAAALWAASVTTTYAVSAFLDDPKAALGIRLAQIVQLRLGMLGVVVQSSILGMQTASSRYLAFAPW